MPRYTQRVRNFPVIIMMRWTFFTILMLGSFVSVSWAVDPIKINSLFAYPDTYKMRVVQVQGTVQNYRMIHGIDPRSQLEGCIQEFLVEDETGTVGASYTTLCGMKPVLLKDGDEVTIEGHFLGTIDVRVVRKR